MEKHKIWRFVFAMFADAVIIPIVPGCNILTTPGSTLHNFARKVDFFSSIRGTAWDDFFVAGGYGQLLHFNGKTWRSYQGMLGLQQGGIASIAVKGNLMIGLEYLGSKAVAFVGKRI
jgi:hypothetical protein